MASSADIKAATLHAVQRCMERSGIRSEERAIRKLFRLAAKARLVKGDQWVADGWVLVVSDGTVRTVYRVKPKLKRKIEKRLASKRKPDIRVTAHAVDQERPR